MSVIITNLSGSWSAATSPAHSPSPSRYDSQISAHHKCNRRIHPYGTTSLCQRSRSPSPARLQELRERERERYHEEFGMFCIQTHFCYEQNSFKI